MTSLRRPGAPAILLVDDEPAVTAALSAALRKQPYAILTASSGAEALAILAARSIDVVISDERMPGMQGSELLTQIRRVYPGTIRIMLTGHASLDAALRAINEGQVFRFLRKPCDPIDLAQTIREALLQRRLRHASATLLSTARHRRTMIETLERSHPGITHLDRAEDGAVVGQIDDTDVAALLDDIDAEIERADE